MCPSMAKLTTSRSHQNAMMHQLDRFDVIINSEWIANTASVHLLFTKWDVFEDKIKGRPISGCFADYTGEDDPQKGLEYFTSKFAQRNRSGKKKSISIMQMRQILGRWKHSFAPWRKQLRETRRIRIRGRIINETSFIPSISRKHDRILPLHLPSSYNNRDTLSDTIAICSLSGTGLLE